MTGSMCSAAGLRGDPLPGCRSHNRAESRFWPALCPVRVFEKMQVVADQSLKLKDIIHFHTPPLPNSAAAPQNRGSGTGARSFLSERLRFFKGKSVAAWSWKPGSKLL